ncbi:hypothetical protein AC792_03890 [Arthrobacter sp. RIT-PI-e]|nr:hypothetical protein AC792_03890 [Arthrobacter sp. RIT-PI-e]
MFLVLALVLARAAAFAASDPRPWIRRPPPSEIQPTFFMSRIMRTGYRAVILVLERLVAPVGSMSRRRLIPSQRSHRATVTGEIRCPSRTSSRWI